MNNLIKQLKTQFYIYTSHPLYKKYSIYLIPSVIAILAIGIVSFITIPQFFKIGETNNQIEELKQKQQEYQAKVSVLEKIELNQYKTWLEDILYTLPSEKDIPGAITSILQIISSSGLHLDNISLGTATTDKAGSSFLVKLDVSGTIDQLKSLVSLSDQSPRLIKINGIALNNSSQNSTQATVDVLVFYAALDENVKTSADQKVNLVSDKEKELIAQIEKNIASLKNVSTTTFTESPSGKDDPFN